MNISNDGTVSERFNLNYLLDDKEDAVRFVSDVLKIFPLDPTLIITIRREKSERSSAQIVITASSDDTPTGLFFGELPII